MYVFVCMRSLYVFFFFFFFQAEDGIRDADMTGVQTCALPISDDGGQRVPPEDGQQSESRLRQDFADKLRRALGDEQTRLPVMKSQTFAAPFILAHIFASRDGAQHHVSSLSVMASDGGDDLRRGLTADAA